jgi:hypothetical protein
MKQYESAFLGLILAGVVMMIIGLGLIMTSARSPDGPHWVFAERQAIERPPTAAAGTSNSAQRIER